MTLEPSLIHGFAFAFAAVWFVLVILALLDVLLKVRSSQAAIAWGLSLILFPYVTLPAYVLFGRRWLRGYRKLTRRIRERQGRKVNRTKASGSAVAMPPPPPSVTAVLEKIGESRFMAGNEIQLLLDGKQFYETLLNDIKHAQHAIYLCFYIVRADTIGQRLKDELVAASGRGVQVKFLYDRFGSFGLPSNYYRAFERAGVEFAGFNGDRTWRTWFQLNFRNHRKIAVIDNTRAYVGGFNVGDEYLGQDAELGPWRDTQLLMIGPVVQAVAEAFAEDWELATGETLEAPRIQAVSGTASALVVTTGPIDDREKAVSYVLELILSARDRLWLSTPYFVPDDAIMSALGLAVARGVDVRLLIPGRSDNRLAQWASLFHAARAVMSGVQVYRYGRGFLHQKAMVVDSSLATVSTANLDNRSLRLNFEMSVTVASEEVTGELVKAFENDFAQSHVLTKESILNQSTITELITSFARLWSPIL